MNQVVSFQTFHDPLLIAPDNLCQCIHNLASHQVLNILYPGNSGYVLEIQLCQTMSKHAQHHMEHRWFPHNKNEEVQNGYFSYFVGLDPHHVVALVDSSVEAIQHILPLNVLLIDEFQVMIAAHILWHADANDFDELHRCG